MRTEYQEAKDSVKRIAGKSNKSVKQLADWIRGDLKPEYIEEEIQALIEKEKEQLVDNIVAGNIPYVSNWVEKEKREARIETAKQIKEICPVTEGASVERLHHRIDSYLERIENE